MAETPKGETFKKGDLTVTTSLQSEKVNLLRDGFELVEKKASTKTADTSAKS